MLHLPIEVTVWIEQHSIEKLVNGRQIQTFLRRLIVQGAKHLAPLDANMCMMQDMPNLKQLAIQYPHPLVSLSRALSTMS